MTGSVAFLVLALAVSVQGLDLEGAKEQRCFPIALATPVDIKWISTVSKWYSPLASRYALYKASVDLTNRPAEDIGEDEVIDSCITWKMSMTGLRTSGFGGKHITYKIKPLKEDSFRLIDSFEFYAPGGDDPSIQKGTSGTCYTTMTDNKTYNFAACCLTDGEMVWTVTSPHKKLSEVAEQKILEHAKSLGFKEDYFTHLRYDTCKKQQKDSKKTEL